MRLWLNGALVEAEAARLDPTDRGFTLGDGLFETILCRGARGQWLDRHLARLRDGAGFLGIPLEWPDPDIAEGLNALIAAEQLIDGAIRITLSRGPAPRGLVLPADPLPTLLIATAASAPAVAIPAQIIVATVTRRNEASPLSRLKTLNFLDNILARREAGARGADDAILLNSRGQVAETSAATLFALVDGVLKTPPVADGALPGIIRGLLIERAGGVEASLLPEDLVRASAVFLTNSLGLRAVQAIDGQAIGDGGSTAFVESLAGTLLSGA